MPRITPAYTFKDNFGEVLNGEFQPAQDPLKRAWSLSQLAHLAVTDGTYEIASKNASFQKGRINFYYQPPWAQNVAANVYGHMYDGIAVIDSFIYDYDEKIGDKRGGELTITAYENPRVWLSSAIYDISSQEGITVARLAITQAAQDFFDTAAHPVA